MTAEEKIFGRKRFLFDRLVPFGFEKTADGYRYKTDIMGGDFTAVVHITGDGEVNGGVTDNMNGEDYTQLHSESIQSAYVNTVRAAYEDALRRIADGCCRSVYFASEQANRIVGHVEEEYGVIPDFPFSDDDVTGVLRHTDTAKWFAIIMPVKMKTLFHNGDETPVDVMNLKACPDKVPELIKRPGVYRAYHMNHKMWISVTLNDALPDTEIQKLVDESFRLTGKKNS